MMVTALPRIELAVSVTTDCTPATSLPSRLWISPVRVPVKNASSIRCRWANSRSRSSRITEFPSLVVSHVCTTPSRAPNSVTAMLAPTSASRSPIRGGPTELSASRGNSARSRTAWVRNGSATPSSEETRIVPATTATRRRWGRTGPRHAVPCGPGQQPLRRAGGRGHNAGTGSHGRRVFRARPEAQPLIPVLRPPSANSGGGSHPTPLPGQPVRLPVRVEEPP